MSVGRLIDLSTYQTYLTYQSFWVGGKMGWWEVWKVGGLEGRRGKGGDVPWCPSLCPILLWDSAKGQGRRAGKKEERKGGVFRSPYSNA